MRPLHSSINVHKHVMIHLVLQIHRHSFASTDHSFFVKLMLYFSGLMVFPHLVKVFFTGESTTFFGSLFHDRK